MLNDTKGNAGMNMNLKLGLASMGLLVIVGMIFQGCSTVPVTERKSLNLVSNDQEMQLGLASFDQVKKETPLSTDATAKAMVERVGRQIAKVADKDMPNAQWEFVLFESKEANAFCLPGGKVGVYTGLLPIAKDDAGLATVLGHEIAHAVAHHGAERMSRAMVVQGVGSLAGSYIGTTSLSQYQSTFSSLYGIGSQVAVELPHSRSQESEADHIGLIYMARAGYDPAQAIAFWQRFAEFNKQQGGGKDSFYSKFLRTHPLDDQRIADLQKWQPEAQAVYVKNPVK
jgi:predicted Zn-dependent protease